VSGLLLGERLSTLGALLVPRGGHRVALLLAALLRLPPSVIGPIALELGLVSLALDLLKLGLQLRDELVRWQHLLARPVAQHAAQLGDVLPHDLGDLHDRVRAPAWRVALLLRVDSSAKRVAGALERAGVEVVELALAVPHLHRLANPAEELVRPQHLSEDVGERREEHGDAIGRGPAALLDR